MRGRIGRATSGILLGGLLALAAPASAEVALEGTWFVVAHFKDEATNNPDALRWVDAVWVFQPEGERLRWTDYPIVVFDDESGRFEGRQRVLAHWEPNGAQRAQLASGPTVNTRGSKSKTLKGSPATGWKSTSKQQRSMAFISYEEKWTIDDPSGLPVFTRVDVLGGGGADSSEGRTLWKTTEVDADGVLHGSYDRDGTRIGTFTARRVGDVQFLSTDGPTPNEKAAERAREELLRSAPGDE